MKKTLFQVISLLVLAAMLLAACAPAATPTPEPTNPPAPTATEAPAPTEAPTNTTEPTATTPPEPARLILATTTSTQDSGLLDFILPDFETEFGARIEVIAVGSGQALQTGKDGNADVLLVHSPAAEKTFMEEKHGVRREDVMYNDFVIVGPESDPAGIAGMKSAVDAFKAIVEKQAKFVSRGDDSGTHSKEKGIWKSAEIEPAGEWYVSAGQGMGAVLTMSDELQAYTLADRATYLKMTQEGLQAKIMVEGDKALFNPYGVIAVDPAKSSKINAELANQFIDWLISVPVQEKIATYGVEEFGQPLFTPSSKPYKEAKAAEAAAKLTLKLTGMVETEQTWKLADIQTLPVVEAEYTDKNGTTTQYSGTLLADLVNLGKPAADATLLVFVAADGFTSEFALADALACTDCIVVLDSDGSLRTVIPGQSGKLQVKGLVEIQVK